MSPRLWEADRTLTLDDARAVISARFPAIDVRESTYIGSGWEFDAYLTSDDWVFRFPRRAHCADLFDTERPAHVLASRVLPGSMAVPRVELEGQPTAGFPYRIAGHRFIQGVAADDVDRRVLPAFAEDIGAALGAIHAIPEETARAAGIAEMAADETSQQEWIDQRLGLASALRGLDPTVTEALRWVRGLAHPFPRFAGPLRFIHNDLSPEHCIVDPATGRLAGILDWTDACLGDPARDFVVLAASLGRDLIERVLRSYPHPVDRQFRERLGFMTQFLSVMWLIEAHEQRAGVAKHIAWVHNASAFAMSS